MHFRKILAEQVARGNLNEEAVNDVINSYFEDLVNKIVKQLKTKKIVMEKLKVTKGNHRTPLGSIDFVSYTRSDFEAKVSVLAHLMLNEVILITCSIQRPDWGVMRKTDDFRYTFKTDDKEMIDVISRHIINALGYGPA